MKFLRQKEEFIFLKKKNILLLPVQLIKASENETPMSFTA